MTIGLVITGYYTCNGDPRGCGGANHGGCRWCDEVAVNDGITTELANSALSLIPIVVSELPEDSRAAWHLLALQRRLIEARRLEVRL